MALVKSNFLNYNASTARKGSFLKMSPEKRDLPQEGRESLASLFRIEEVEFPPFSREWIPLNDIITLPQPRKTFPKIESLAENIAAQEELIYPLLVGRHSRESAEKYLKAVNCLWETNYKIEDLNGVIEKGEEVFYILIAGERRLRACRLLQKEGCQVCQEEYGPGGCYDRHFGSQTVEAKVYPDITPLQAFSLQAAENIHEEVPPYEQALFYRDLFFLIKEANTACTQRQFARMMGRSPEAISKALKVCELPLNIQRFIENKDLAYGGGYELSRLQRELEMSEEGLMVWTLLVITGGYSVKEIQEMVSRHIYERKSGQTMFDIFSQEEERIMRRLHMRKVVSHKNALILHASIHYLEGVYRMFLEGKLGRADSPFSEGSPVRIYMRLIRLQQILLPHLRDFLTGKEYREAQETLQEAEEVTSLLLAQWEVREKGSPFIFLLPVSPN